MSIAVLIIIGVFVVYGALAIFCAGSAFGYKRGEDDTISRVKFIKWNESSGVTREEYFKDK